MSPIRDIVDAPVDFLKSKVRDLVGDDEEYVDPYDQRVRLENLQHRNKVNFSRLTHKQQQELLDREYQLRGEFEKLDQSGQFRLAEMDFERDMFKDDPQGYWQRKRSQYQLEKAQIQDDFDKGMIDERERDFAMSQVDKKIKSTPETRIPTPEERFKMNSFWMKDPVSGTLMPVTFDKEGTPQVLRGYSAGGMDQGLDPQQVMKDYSEVSNSMWDRYEKEREKLSSERDDLANEMQDILAESEQEYSAQNFTRVKSLRARGARVEARIKQLDERLAGLQEPNEEMIGGELEKRYGMFERLSGRMSGNGAMGGGMPPSPSPAGPPQAGPPRSSQPMASAPRGSMADMVSGMRDGEPPSDQELEAAGVTEEDIRAIAREQAKQDAEAMIMEKAAQDLAPQRQAPTQRSPASPPSIADEMRDRKVQRTVSGPEAAKVLSQLPPEAQEQIRVLTRKLETATNQSAREIARRDLIKLLLELGLVTDADANSATAAGPAQ